MIAFLICRVYTRAYGVLLHFLNITRRKVRKREKFKSRKNNFIPFHQLDSAVLILHHTENKSISFLNFSNVLIRYITLIIIYIFY